MGTESSPFPSSLGLRKLGWEAERNRVPIHGLCLSSDPYRSKSTHISSLHPYPTSHDGPRNTGTLETKSPLLVGP